MLKIAIAQISSVPIKETISPSALTLMRPGARAGAEMIVFPEFHMAFSPASQTAVELNRACRIPRRSVCSRSFVPPRKRPRSHGCDNL